MAIELKQSLRLSQQLLITPQLQQAIKLLQLSRAELVETIQKELLENPVLEESAETNGPIESIGATERLTDLSTATGDGTSATVQAEHGDKNDGKEFDWASFIESSHSRSFETRGFSSTDDLPNYENMLTRAASLQDHLDWQVKLSDINATEMKICEAIIGNINDDGYLSSPVKDIAGKEGFTVDEVDDALTIIQDLDPPGVGASNLQECLLLQIRDFGTDKKILTDMIKNQLNLLERRDYAGLSKRLGLTLRRVKDLAQIIFNLDPKPGRVFGSSDAQYIMPDVYIKKIADEYVVILNEDGLPKLQISNLYKKAILKEMAARQTSGENGVAERDATQNYIQEKLKSALWLIKSIHQRQKTLYKVTKSIASFQQEFMDKGVQAMKPLVLRDVADDIGVHESTVSRATNGKFVHTPQGIFELKYFFNTGLSSSAGGEDFANEAVKQLVRQTIEGESNCEPLSDQAISEILQGKSINIARRTVAKYREMLGILPSSRRKRMS